MIPVNTPLLAGNEAKYLENCIQTGWISSEGPYVSEFETKMAERVNRKYGIAVANGSGALDIAIQALDIGPGDEVILPTFTIISPVFSVLRAGATPILVDSEPDTWNMNVAEIASKITKRTKAIIVVHIYGLPVDMDPIIDLCKKHSIYLVEDAAELIGQNYKDAPCGSFGEISTFSFYPNKQITTGEGGMVVCNDDQLAERCRKLRNLAFEEKGRRFVHYEMGWNYRMTNLQAALGLAQLEQLDMHVQRKREIGESYLEKLDALVNFQLPMATASFASNIYWVFGLVARNQKLAENAVELLSKQKIGTRPFFWCMHEQPVFLNMGLFAGESYPVAENLARCGFYIPSGLGLSNEEIDLVCKTLIEWKQ